MNKVAKLILAFAFASGLTSVVANAQVLPGKHPGYLHSLTDLRTARWYLFHQPGDAKVYEGEDAAIREVEAAIGDIKKAAADDGKDLNDHPNVDVHEHGSRLLKAIESLKKARADIEGEEDNPDVRDLRHRAFEHIDKAIKGAEHAHDAWLKEQKN
jgi:hypothetical protein